MPDRVGLRPAPVRDPRGAPLRPARDGGGEKRARRSNWRARDVTREVDVVEEVRASGFDVSRSLPRAGPCSDAHPGAAARRRLGDALVGLGFTEAYTPSLRPRATTRRGSLPEPISFEQSLLRTTMFPAWSSRRSNVDAATRRHRPVRDCAGLPPGWGSARGALARCGRQEGGFLRAKGASSPARRADTRARLRAVDPAAAPPGKAASPGRLARRAHPHLEGSWGVPSSISSDLFAGVPSLCLPRSP